jgi:hypothetical protein
LRIAKSTLAPLFVAAFTFVETVSMAENRDRIEDFNTVEFTANKSKTNRKTVYDAISRKEIPVIRIGRAIRFPGAWPRKAAAISDVDPGYAISSDRESAPPVRHWATA